MKKSELWRGVGFLAGGVVCLTVALMLDTLLGSLFCGFAGALIAPGAAQVLKYRKWSRPENAAAYREKLVLEQIEQRDERKELLRNKAGRYAFVLGLLLCTACILAFAVLGELGLVAVHRPAMLMLGGFLIVQLAAFFLFYRWLEEKY